MVESCPEFVVETDNTAVTAVTSGGSGEIVPFFYEIVTLAENSDVEGTIAAVETRILQDVAASFLSCAGRRRLQATDGTIARIESDPPDVVDEGNECSTETGIAVADDMKCIPVLGAMTFYTDCDDCNLPTKDILKNIRASMEDGVYADGTIVEQVSFAGAGDIKLDSQPGVAVGSALGVIAALGVLALAAVYKRKKRSHNHHEFMDREVEIAAEEAEESAFNAKQAVKLEEWRTVQEEDGAINVAPPSEFHSHW